MPKPSALEKALADAAKIMERYGQSLDTDAIVHADEIAAEKEVKKKANSNALEVIINSLHHAHASTMKLCMYCGEQYITTYCYHQFCSDRCRTLEFIDRFKIDPAKLKPPASFWEYEDIGIVSSEMTKRLYGWAKHLVEQYETLLSDEEFENLPETDSVVLERETNVSNQTSSPQSSQTPEVATVTEDLESPTSPLQMLGNLELPVFDF